MSKAMRIEELGSKLAPGDVVTCIADAAYRGVSIQIPGQRCSHTVSRDDCWVSLYNSGESIEAMYRGQCFGDPNKWIRGTGDD